MMEGEGLIREGWVVEGVRGGEMSGNGGTG